MTTPNQAPQDDPAPHIPALQPLDEHNRVLMEAGHPPAHVNPTPAGRYNLVVIGAGTAGLVTAAGAAGLGAKVALIERELMGGDCLNVGCVPSKALISCARAAAHARQSDDLGVRITGDVTTDFPAVMERMRRLRAGISDDDSVKRFSSLGIDVFIGQGSFDSDRSIVVGGQRLEFSKAVVATGARAAAPPIPGLEDAGYLTNETVFSLTELPRRLVVIGAGPIGCELAQSFARFGSEVTLIESAGQILTREDPDAATIVAESLKRDGVNIICGGKGATISTRDGEKIVSAQCHGQQMEIACDEILVGVGRKPNVENLGLETAGIAFDPRTGVTVNDKLRTSNKHVYAAGDICSRFKFTHTADALARIVIQNALFFGRAKASKLIIPWCTYTDPEVAHVGMYEHDAKDAGLEIDTFKIEMAQVHRAILEGDHGFLKVHVKKGTDQIVGATIVSEHAGEMISELTLAMTAGKGLGTIAKTIHPYPTVAEVIKRAGDAYSRTRLTPTVQKLFHTLLRWRR